MKQVTGGSALRCRGFSAIAASCTASRNQSKRDLALATLFGWCVLLPAVYLLWRFCFDRDEGAPG